MPEERREEESTVDSRQSTVEPQDEAAPDSNGAASAEDKAAEYLELAQRTQADFENFRKRAVKDMAAAGARAKAGLIRELLPVVDNLERAIVAVSDEGVGEGLKLVYAELEGVLSRNGVVAMEPTGQQFDPNVHEAISTRPAEDVESGTVVDVVEKGYRLDATVIRPARVVVAA
jgi:molecular chaperone GrpE